MTTVLVLRFLIVLVAMMVAGAVGYLLARHRIQQQNADQIAMMAAQIARMRRRASAAESEAVAAQATLSRTRRKMRHR